MRALSLSLALVLAGCTTFPTTQPKYDCREELARIRLVKAHAASLARSDDLVTRAGGRMQVWEAQQAMDTWFSFCGP